MNTILLILALTLAVSTASAAEPGVGYGGTVGTLTLETRDLSTTPDEVRRQGGFATAGAVRWTQAPVVHPKLSAVTF